MLINVFFSDPFINFFGMKEYVNLLLEKYKNKRLIKYSKEQCFQDFLFFNDIVKKFNSNSFLPRKIDNAYIVFFVKLHIILIIFILGLKLFSLKLK
ncbi:hypothetical protein BCR23_11720 [Enterococcus quebecensis]|uniref:Uncharacterized protein n=1 Tax=Enterococcus quebecensis TaxID=903983 RepID=A0A1E5GQT3_9ENTE|nr:hypothetical protein BCR23_11720 [Enterococcus quebecensis]